MALVECLRPRPRSRRSRRTTKCSCAAGIRIFVRIFARFGQTSGLSMGSRTARICCSHPMARGGSISSLPAWGRRNGTSRCSPTRSRIATSRTSIGTSCGFSARCALSASPSGAGSILTVHLFSEKPERTILPCSGVSVTTTKTYHERTADQRDDQGPGDDHVRLQRRGSVVARTAGALKSDAPPLTAEALRQAAEEAIAEGALERAD